MKTAVDDYQVEPGVTVTEGTHKHDNNQGNGTETEPNNTIFTPLVCPESLKVNKQLEHGMLPEFKSFHFYPRCV